MVTKVVPLENLLDEAMAMAYKFSKGPTKAYGISKNLLNSAYSEPLEAQLDSESRGIASSIGSEDGRHGIDSFYNKKKPTFKGK
jgi:enoyl-CoA hydratase/carnithine racemase